MKHKPNWSNKNGVVIGYMDKISFDHEIGCALGGETVYATLEDFVNKHHEGKCASCGVVQIEIKLKKVIQESFCTRDRKLFKKIVREDNERIQRLRNSNFKPIKIGKKPSNNKEVNNVTNSNSKRRAARTGRATKISSKRKR